MLSREQHELCLSSALGAALPGNCRCIALAGLSGDGNWKHLQGLRRGGRRATLCSRSTGAFATALCPRRSPLGKLRFTPCGREQKPVLLADPAASLCLFTPERGRFSCVPPLICTNQENNEIKAAKPTGGFVGALALPRHAVPCCMAAPCHHAQSSAVAPGWERCRSWRSEAGGVSSSLRSPATNSVLKNGSWHPYPASLAQRQLSPVSAHPPLALSSAAGAGSRQLSPEGWWLWPCHAAPVCPFSWGSVLPRQLSHPAANSAVFQAARASAEAGGRDLPSLN